ncbi:MAG: cell division protein FtsZ, partial [Eggerthellaceae bacterium]|nr:cell division protein FtsZ [Eggerthellaceae bacterium]
ESCADDSANIIYGQIIDEQMGDDVRVTVIATGFKGGSPKKLDPNNIFSANMANSARAASVASSADAANSAGASKDAFAQNSSSFVDKEDYIPDFLKRK